MAVPRALLVAPVVVVATLFAAVASTTAPSTAGTASSPSADGFQFIALGDAPYNEEEERQFNLLIDRINAEPSVAFVVHVGDIKGGEEPCTDALLQRRRNQLLGFKAPLLYTPGDNEWTDCHRKRAGQFNPVERLERVRALFFADVDERGQRRLGRLQVQTQAESPEHRRFVENWRVEHEGALLAGVHVVGSENGLEPWTGLDPDDSRSRPRVDRLAEFQVREAAAVAWIHETFAHASRRGLTTLVLVMQANPRFELEPDARGRTGFNQVLAALRSAVARFDGEVLLVHGDYHRFEFDRPWATEEADPRLARFSRLQVFGSPAVRAVRIRFDPRAQPRLQVEPFPPQ